MSEPIDLVLPKVGIAYFQYYGMSEFPDQVRDGILAERESVRGHAHSALSCHGHYALLLEKREYKIKKGTSDGTLTLIRLGCRQTRLGSHRWGRLRVGVAAVTIVVGPGQEASSSRRPTRLGLQLSSDRA